MEQLRATLHSDLQEKNDILDKLTNERGKSSVFLLRTKGYGLDRVISSHLCLLRCFQSPPKSYRQSFVK